MNPRYVKGTERPPIYVCAVKRNQSNGGAILLLCADGSETQIPFLSHKQLVFILEALMKESVPLSVGGHCPGPAEEVAMLISAGELKGKYIELSWSGPGRYVAREIVEGAWEWEEAANLSMIANTSFNPDTLCAG